jgi:hypothetical protein
VGCEENARGGGDVRRGGEKLRVCVEIEEWKCGDERVDIVTMRDRTERKTARRNRKE